MRKVKEKKSRGFQIFGIILSVLLVVALAFTVFEIFTLNVLPTNLLVPVVLILVILSLIVILLVNFVSRKLAGKIFSSLLALVMTGVLGWGSYYLYTTGNMLSNITTHDGETKNTVSVITLKSASYESLEDLEDANIGYLKKIDNYGTEQFLKDASKELGYDKTSMLDFGVQNVYAQESESSQDAQENKEKKPTFEDDYSYLPFTQKDYPSIQALAKALYDKDVDAIILNETYRANLEELEDYIDFASETNVVYQTVYYTDKENEALVVSDITSEPFNIFISGNDTYGDVGELSRSDVNMIVTVNPSTSTVLLTSIPRDTYVESACDAADGCQQGAMDKITHLGIHGVNASKMTAENLLGIEINYTFRVNFSSVMDIVDALGGIDIFVEEGMAVDSFYADNTLEGVQEGWNHLDGKRALSFARERYAYQDGDNQRVKNQQKVLEAIFDKATSPDIIVKYASLMDAFSGAFETNMSTSEITSLIQYQLQSDPSWTFESYQVAGAGDMMYCAEAGQELSVTVPDMRTVQVAREKIQAVMDGESSDSVDTEWLDTTSPVYNYWGNYDSTADYKNGDTIEAPQDVYVPSDTTNGYTEYYDTQTYVPETDYQETYPNEYDQSIPEQNVQQPVIEETPVTGY